MRSFIWLLAFAAVGALSVPALGDEPDPKEIVIKADQATRAVKSVSYKIRIWGEGSAKDRLARVRAAVMVKHGGETRPPYYWIKGSARPAGAEERVPFYVVYGDTQAMSIDEEEKRCVVADLRIGIDLIGALIIPSSVSVTMSEFLRDEPFSDELEADALVYEGRRTIGGVACHVIHVTYKGGVARARWYFGVDDSLPRRVDRISEDVAGLGARVSELFELDVSPKFDETTFAVVVPEGYESQVYERPLRSDPQLLAVGADAPAWTLDSAGGGRVSLASLRGKVVVLNFWASWRPPCVELLPYLQKLHERYAGAPVAVLGVNTGEQDAEVDPGAFAKGQGCGYGILLEGGAVASAYRVTAIPTLYIIGPDGKVLAAMTGYDPTVEPALFKLIESACPK